MTHESRFYIRSLLDKEVSRASQKCRFAAESIDAWTKQYPSFPVPPILLAGVEMAEEELDAAHAALDDFEQEQKELEGTCTRPITASGTVHYGRIDYSAIRDDESWTPSNEDIKKRLLAMGTKGEGEKHD